MIWEWRRAARGAQTIVIVALIWTATLALWIALDLAITFAILFILATFGLLIDYLRDARMHLTVRQGSLTWSNGRRSGDVALTADTTVSLRRRFDGGLRIVVTGPDGEIRLPPELAPPLAALEAALQQTQASVRRDPFRLI